MNMLIGVVVAFLSNGTMDYAALDAKDEADCRQKVAETAQQRLDHNDEEEVKVLGFSFECIEFENKAPVSVPNEPAPAQPKHIPAADEA